LARERESLAFNNGDDVVRRANAELPKPRRAFLAIMPTLIDTPYDADATPSVLC